MPLRDRYKTNTARETEGVWLEFDDCRVKIRRAGKSNKEFVKALSKYSRELQLKTLNEERTQAISRQVFASTVICGWETLVDGEWVEGIDPAELGQEGDLLPVSSEHVEAVLKELPEFWEVLLEYASDRETFIAANREENAKNS